MKNKLLLIALICSINTLFGQNSLWKADYKKSRSFIENQGQFDYLENEKTGKIEFAADFGTTRILFSKKGILYQFAEVKKEPKAERAKLAAGDITTIEEYKKYEKSLYGKYSLREDDAFMQWQNSNPNKAIQGLNKTSDYHSYTYFDKKEGKQINKNLIPGFDKLVYKNIYPNIDAEFVVHPESGIKYSFIVHPNADPSLISMFYDKDVQLLNGEIHIPTKFGDIIDHEPYSFYDQQQDFVIDSRYELVGNRVSFKLGTYDRTKTLVIDPWVQTPTFPTNWDCVWECEKDAAGNVYIIGGIMPMQLIKYNSTGTLQWTFNTPYDTTSWLGTFATDNAGNSYVTQGSTAKILKVNTAGAQQWSNNNPGTGLSAEFWTIAFNCDQTKLVIGGAGGTIPPLPYIYQMDLSNGNTTSSVQMTGGSLIPTQEVRAITATENGRYYYLTHDSIGYISDNLSACGGLGNSNTKFANGSPLGYKCENFRVNNTGIAAIKTYGNFVFLNRGDRLEKRDFYTSAIIATVPIPGGGFPGGFGGSAVNNSGIDIDDCGNIFVGSTNGVYKFNQSLVQQGASFPTSFNVYDVHVSTNGDVIACGSTGNSNSNSRTGSIQSFAGGACAPIAIECCNATFCNPSPLCESDAPVNLTPTTPGGTWSGTGVNASGIFNPATAGAGAHTITYTLPCGSETQTINVSPCQALELCQETNGTLTVTNGVGPYTWEHTTTTTTNVTNQAQCTACGGTWLLFSCTVQSCSSTGYVQFATGSNATPTTNFPIRVTDSQGNEIILNSLAGIPSCSATPPCPTITVSTSNQSNATCTSPGAATVSAAGGTAPYTYSWTPGNLNGATQNSLAAGTYTVTATDANNCTGTTTVTITSAGAVTASVSSQTNINCNGLNSGSATVAGAGGTAPYTYSWSPGGLSGPTQHNLAAGTYTVTVNDANNCSTTVTVTFTEPTALVLNTSTTPASCGTADGSATVQVQGGTTPYSYSWSPTGGSAATANALNSGPYVVTVTDAAGCTSNQNVNVPSNGGPTLSIANQTNASCTGSSDGSATISVQGGTPGYTYSWDTPNGNGVNATNLAAGTYTLTVTDANSCTVSITVTITSGSSITLVETITPEDCGANDGQISVVANGGTGNLTYAWTPNSGSGASISNLSAGNYSLTVTDANGCSATENYVVGQIGGINPTITPSSAFIFEGDSVQITAAGGNNYTWTPSTGLSCTNCPNPTASPSATTTYFVTVVDENGCIGDTSITITVHPVCGEVFVPTIFSPNGDGQNDFECVMGNCIVELDFSIYNRWGEQVFKTSEPSICWDGYYKGKLVNSGTFVYKIYVRMLDGTDYYDNGNITVIR